ncbi:MAG: hypothetical protein IJL85_00895 [Erysipelotrichaceae bacterium]|nr:hypothetical protein [Erysipelotrichaceae bacterium]
MPNAHMLSVLMRRQEEDGPSIPVFGIENGITGLGSGSGVSIGVLS